MAKRKSARQRRATRKRAYYKRQYMETLAAISAIEEMGIKVPKITIPKKITKASVGKVRKEYAKAKKKAKEKNIKLPTKKELAKSAMEDPNQAYKYKRGREFDPGEQYLEAFKDNLRAQMPAPRRKMSEDYYWRLYDSEYYPAVERAIGKIDYGAQKIGAYEMSQALASNDYLARVLEIPYWYIDEAIGYVENEIGSLITEAMNSVLDEIGLEE